MGNEKTGSEYDIFSLYCINPMQMLMTWFTFHIKSTIFPKAILNFFSDSGQSYDNDFKNKFNNFHLRSCYVKTYETRWMLAK